MREVKVTRKYQITIPEDIRKVLQITIGEKLPVERKCRNIVIEAKKSIEKPSDYLWGISKRSTKVDVVGLVKGSRRKMR